MKVILYGLGRGLRYIEEHLRAEHQIIGYSDSFAKLNVYKGLPFYKMTDISEASTRADYIVVAIRERKAAWQVAETLHNICGIPEDKIVPFYVYASSELWKYRLATTDLENVEGIILGNSLAYLGICPDFLSRTFVNLSVPSQDLYGCLYALKRFLSAYKAHGGAKLKYLLVDLYDYLYFNYDISSSKGIFSHITSGGCIAPHNFARNKHYSVSFEEALLSNCGIKVPDDGMSAILDGLFTESIALDFFVDKEYYSGIKVDEPLPLTLFSIALITKQFTETIKENKSILEQLINEGRAHNPNLKIVFTLLPRFHTAEEAQVWHMRQWRAEFQEHMEKICRDFNCTIWDYKKCTEISENSRFYYDIAHLNIVGASSMTSIIEEDLKRYIYD